jgi:hypothetical protein
MSGQKPDQYHGHGGSYRRDPKTGERTLVFRTQPAGEAQAAPAPAPATKPTLAAVPKPDKGAD